MIKGNMTKDKRTNSNKLCIVSEIGNGVGDVFLIA